MGGSNYNFRRVEVFSDNELRALAQQVLKTSKELHDLVLIRVPADDINRPQSKQHWWPVQQEAIRLWEAQARQEDICFNIERRWIPYQCVFLPDTDLGRKLQNFAETFGQIPIQASVLPRNQNQAYWLKSQHYLYQAIGLVVGNELFPIFDKAHHPLNLLQTMVGVERSREIETLAAADKALYKLIQTVTPYLRKSGYRSDLNTDDEDYALRLFIEIQNQDFLNAWNAGPANQNQKQTSLKKKEDWYTNKVIFLRKLGAHSQLKLREEEYREEIAQSGTYWKVLHTAISPNDSWMCLESYQCYIEALAKVKPAYVHDISWFHGQPYKLESQSERSLLVPRPRLCSTVSEEVCECRFKFLGTDLNHSHCLDWAKQAMESPRRANIPRPIRGTTNMQGFILWVWA